MLVDEQIPIVSANEIGSVYSNAKVAKARYKELIDAFKSKFGNEPEFLCRSPGRVNLIGEHIDYSGFSVFPMAIERDMVMAVSTKQGDSIIANVNSKYPDKVFKNDANIDIDSSVHEWSNYFLCGFKGIAQKMNLDSLKPMQVMCSGNVPAGGGLSSSSAFVCCAAVATHHANQGNVTKGGLTEAAINGEQYAGVRIGGMDQSISVMAPSGSALLIDFYPKLGASAIKFPSVSPAPVFVIANSLVVSDKHVTAPRHYNLRVVECRLAAALLLKKLTGKTTDKVITLLQVLNAETKAVSTLDKLTELLNIIETKKFFKQGLYSIEDVAKELEITTDLLQSLFIGSIVIEADGFKLFARTIHVLNEAKRVLQFQQVCSSSDGFLEKIGSLMNQSHESCRDLFECSCPELDQLRTIALESGSLGTRLTGAGWGGCTVSLLPENQVSSFIAQVKEKYYSKNFPGLSDAELDDAIFASRPCLGASVWNGNFE